MDVYLCSYCTMKKFIHRRFFVLFFLILCALSLSTWEKSVLAQPANHFEGTLPVDFSIHRIGPFYARVFGVGQDARLSSILYALTYGSGMYKSVDAGKNWSPISVGLDNLTLQSMAVDPVISGTIYAGTYANSTAPYNGIYKSTNGGESWRPTGIMENDWHGAVYQTPIVYAIDIDPFNHNRIYAATRMRYTPQGTLGGGGVFRSDNGGDTWMAINNGLPLDDLYVYDLAVDPLHKGRVYAALHQQGLFRSDDHGDHWVPVEGIPTDGRAIAIDPFNASIVYYGSGKIQGAFRSTDSGATWLRIGENGWDVVVSGLSSDPYHRHRLYASIFVNNKDTLLMRSEDSGNNWVTSAEMAPWGSLVFSSNGRAVFAGVDFDGVYKYVNDEKSWIRSSNGLSGFPVTGAAISGAHPNLLFASLYGLGVYQSTDGGGSWFPAGSGVQYFNLLSLAMDPQNEQVLYTTTDQSGIYRTTDGGKTWTPLSDGYPAAETSAASSSTGLVAGNAVAVSPGDSGTVLVGTNGRGIYRLSGSTWLESSVSTGAIYSFCFDRNNPMHILAGGDEPLGGVLLSTDNGQNWNPSNGGLDGLSVYSLAQNPDNMLQFIAGTSSGVYQSNDGGANWALAGLSGWAVKSVGILQKDNRSVFLAGTDEGAFYSLGMPIEWKPVEGLDAGIGVQGIIQEPGKSAVYFCTRLGGLIHIEIK